MITDLTLELDHDGIRLMQRTPAGAREVGAVRLDDPDFERRLASLRDGVGAAPVDAEVLLPRSLVLFVDAAGADPAEVEAQVEARAACPIEDLVLCHAGPLAAAVERATLEEARDFAEAHGFKPTAFVAHRAEGAVPVAFELTSPLAFRSHRAATPVTVEAALADQPEQAALHPALPVTEDDDAAIPEFVPLHRRAALDTPVAPARAAAGLATHPVDPFPNPAETVAPGAEDAASATVVRTPDNPSAGAALPAPEAAPAGPAAQAGAAARPDPRAEPTADLAADAEQAKRDRPAPDAAPSPPAPSADPAARGAAPAVMRFASAAPAAAKAGPASATPTPAPAAGFAHTPLAADAAPAKRDRPAPDAAPSLSAPSPAARGADADAPAVMRFASAAPATAKAGPASATPTPAPAAGFAHAPLDADAVQGKRDHPASGATPSSGPATGPESHPTLIAALAAADAVAPVRPAPVPAARQQPSPAAAEPAAPAAPRIGQARTEADALAVFGARRNPEPEPRRLRPIHAAAGALAAVVLAAAAWTFRDPPAAPEIVDVEQTAAAALDPVDEALPDLAAQAAVDTPAESPEPEPATLETAALDPGVGIEAAPDVPAPVAPPANLGPALPPAEPPAAAAPTAPETPAAQEPEAEVAFTPPPPPGSVYDMDERGFVRATEAGALTPQGVMVHAGRPPVVPPEAVFGPPPVAPTPAETQDGAAAQPETTVAALAPEAALEAEQDDVADAAQEAPAATAQPPEDLAALAPEIPPVRAAPRPEASATAAPAGESAEDDVAAVPDLPTEPEPTSPEPDTAAAEVAAPDLAAAAAALQIPPARPAARPAGLVPAPAVPRVAVLDADATTPHPRARPARPATAVAAAADPDFNALAAQARTETAAAAAAATPAPRAAAPAATPAPAPAAPRAAATPPTPQGRANVAVAPSAPTRGSVAERATVANALALNRVNLIGVYGSASDRRALIRLPTGRYVKVKVGDRVDGGRVAAIEQSSVQYEKNGQRYALRLPNG